MQFDMLIPGIERREKGEITTLLTFFSVGLILIGTVVATKLVESSTESRSKAAERNLQTLSTSCGNLPATSGDEKSGTGCQLNTKPEVSRECASCITANQPGFRAWWDSVGHSACNNVQIVSNWRQMEPDGKRNFYKGHTTEAGGPCNCFCSRELANPDVDYGNSPLPAAPTSTPPAPTTPPIISLPSPTPPPPPPTPEILFPTEPPIVIEATPTQTVIFPTPFIENTQPPLPPPTPTPGIQMGETISNEIKKIQSTLEDTSEKGVALSKTLATKGKNWLWQIFSNFLTETSF